MSKAVSLKYLLLCKRNFSFNISHPRQKGSKRWLISRNIFRTSIFSTEFQSTFHPGRSRYGKMTEVSALRTIERPFAVGRSFQDIIQSSDFNRRVVIRNRQWRKSKWHLAEWRRQIWVVIEETRRKIRPLDYSSRETPVMRLWRLSLRDSRTRVRRNSYYKTPFLPRALLYVIAKYDNPR